MKDDIDINNKIKIFFDFDNTLVNSTKAFITVYNKLYKAIIDYKDIYNYDFYPHISNLSQKEISQLFASELFYDNLEIFDGVIDCLKKLTESRMFELILVTNCSPESVCRKVKYIETSPLSKYLSSKIYLDMNKPFGKYFIDMQDSVLIDDHVENHLTSNAKVKLSFVANKMQTWSPSPEKYKNINLFYNWNYLDINNLIMKKYKKV